MTALSQINEALPQLSLDDKLKILPREPGCYLFKDGSGKIIYVGKAKVLRNRVRSYFSGRSDGRHQYEKLVACIHDVETIVTRDEVEALVLEANLIRRHRPRFNIDMRDDRSYPYLKVTRELFPRVFLTRSPKNDRSIYYGPLTDVTQIKHTVNALRQACKIRTCNLQITETGIRAEKYRLCLEYHIGNCDGPCVGKVSPEEYKQGIDALVETVNGKESELVELLEARMKKLSHNLKYEEASRVRDQIQAIQSLTNRQKMKTLDTEDRDVFGFYQEDRDACISVLRIRSGRMIGRSHSILSRIENMKTEEILTRFLADFYLPASRIPPDRIILPLLPEDQDIELLEQFLRQKRNRKVTLAVPRRGDRVRLLKLATHNAELLLKEHRIARENRTRIPQSLVTLRDVLQLQNVPHIIECFDNSNLQGNEPVASMVRFKNAKPDKKNYRLFKIKNVEGIDDYASMQEVVGRRYSRLLKEQQPLPDLVVIDGGKGQVNAARLIIDRMGLNNLPMIGLAKRLEEIYLPGQPGPITLPKTSSALKILMQIRDEAHRTAITFHRKLHSEKTVSTTLTSIPGIGEARAKALLRHFGSLKRLKEADEKMIAEVPGFSKQSGIRLLKILNSEPRSTTERT